MGQLGLFDLEERLAKLTQMGEPLVGLNEQIDWEAFRADLNRVPEKERKSNAGAKPIDVVLMFKVLVLQHLHNRSDDRIEYPIRDRLSFMRFLGLQLEDRVPDAKTVWLFREQLKELKRVDVRFNKFHDQLAARGYVARAGQMIDATFTSTLLSTSVEVPRQRNGREENAQLKAGETPEEWQAESAQPMRRQKDVDARWTKKNNETHYGYKNHINADQDHKLVHSYQVTDASVHDRQVFEELLDQTLDDKGKKRAGYADSAYRSQEQEDPLAADSIPRRIGEKGARNYPLTEAQKTSNKEKAKVRARVEHVFGAQAQMGGHLVRTLGLLRAEVKIGLMNLVYNRVRLGHQLRRDRRGAPAVA